MDASWSCLLCEFVADVVTDLADHLEYWHDEWLNTGQVPPLRAPNLSF